MDGILLREQRELHGYTQKKLAELAGIKTWSVAAYETGRQQPSIITAYRLSKVLNCPELCSDLSSGDKIKILRLEKGFSQDAFAEACGVSRVAVSAWENNRSTPAAKMQRKIAEILECSLADIV